jgi:hypothetical protein
VKGLVNVGLPFLRRAELFVLHQLELICCDVTIQRENRESVLKIHREGFLLEWEANEDVLYIG